jgi:copper(I)-binding protein
MQFFSRFSLLVLSVGLLPFFANAAATASDAVSISNPYVRAVPEGQPNSAAFMTLRNNGTQDVAIIDARSDVSDAVELHTHRMEGGMMRMRRIKQIDIKAGSETMLMPGGLHIMFIGLKQALPAGSTISLELLFSDGSSRKLDVPVKIVTGMKHPKGKHMPQ